MSSQQTQPQKVVEFYIDTLKHYKDKFKKDKLILLMQVGEFLELYGLIYPDGSRVGDLLEFCEKVNLKIIAMSKYDEKFKEKWNHENILNYFINKDNEHNELLNIFKNIGLIQN